MGKLTAGDIMHVYGSFGQKTDYNVRLVVRMEDEIDGDMLQNAVAFAARRYPYLLLKMKCDDNEIFYEDNNEPIAVLNRKESVTLGAAVSSSRNKAIAKATPSVEAKMQTYGMMLSGGRRLFTCMVSYVGKWKYPSVGKHIKEFWTHVPNANGFLVEIAAVNGKIFLTMHQNFEEDTVVRAFEKELTENGISFETTEMLNDVAHLDPPVG